MQWYTSLANCMTCDRSCLEGGFWSCSRLHVPYLTFHSLLFCSSGRQSTEVLPLDCLECCMIVPQNTALLNCYRQLNYIITLSQATKIPQRYVITGDNAVTAASIARQCGILPDDASSHGDSSSSDDSSPGPSGRQEPGGQHNGGRVTRDPSGIGDTHLVHRLFACCLYKHGSILGYTL